MRHPAETFSCDSIKESINVRAALADLTGRQAQLSLALLRHGLNLLLEDSDLVATATQLSDNALRGHLISSAGLGTGASLGGFIIEAASARGTIGTSLSSPCSTSNALVDSAVVVSG